MRPVQIPGGTVITGNGTGSITSRSPIQIVGDDVRISDIELVFSSSNSLNSVPHREIFLAGHSLTLDNVSTYLEGAAGSLGGLGGTEKELLPSVYAGAYYDTFCGNMARLTIEHANKMTVFQKPSTNTFPFSCHIFSPLHNNSRYKDSTETFSLVPFLHISPDTILYKLFLYHATIQVRTIQKMIQFVSTIYHLVYNLHKCILSHAVRAFCLLLLLCDRQCIF